MKKQLIALTQVAIVAVLMLACQTSSQNTFTDADKEAITKAATDAVSTFNASKDVPAYINAYYAESAIVLMPNSEPVQGREAIINGFKAFGDFSMTFTIDEITGNDDLAYVVGKAKLVFPDGLVENMKYMEIWRKSADGKWQTTRDIFNSSDPLKAP